MSRAEVEGLLTTGEIGLRDKTLWRMLCETAARISEVLSLDVADLNMAIHQGRGRRRRHHRVADGHSPLASSAP